MNIATDGRNPSLLQYVLRGVAFLLVLLVIFVLLFMRYQGTFSKTVAVTADLVDVGDGLSTGADVRYNGLIVGTVKSISVEDSDVEAELAALKAGKGPEALQAGPGQGDVLPTEQQTRQTEGNA